MSYKKFIPTRARTFARTVAWTASALLAMSITASTSQAQLQEGSLNAFARADQDVFVAANALGNNPELNLRLSALGNFEFSWAAESGGVADVTEFTANFTGTDGALGAFSLFAGSTTPANIAPTGTLTNIVESGGMLLDADFTINTPFSITLLDFGSAMIYTQEVATFTGRLSEGFFSSPDVNDDDLNGHLFDGDADLSNDPVVAVSSNRTVTAVPEPGSALILITLAGLALASRRKS